MRQKGEMTFSTSHLWEKRAKAPLENVGTQTILKISPPDYKAHIFVVFYFYSSSGSLAIKKSLLWLKHNTETYRGGLPVGRSGSYYTRSQRRSANDLSRDAPAALVPSNTPDLFPQTEGKSVSKKELVELKNYAILVKNHFFSIFFKTVSFGW